MPQLQVIGRQPMAPTQVADDLSKIMERKRTLEIQKQIAATNAKNALTETDKLKYDRIKNAIEMFKFFNDKEIPIKPEDISQIAMVNGIGHDAVFEALAQIGGAIGQAPRSPKARIESAQASILENMLPSQAGQPPTPGGSQGLPLNVSQARGPVLGGMNIEGMSFEYPEAKASIAREETFAREKAKMEADVGPVRNVFNKYIQALDNASNAMGGLPESALGARIKGSVAGLTSEVGKLPEVQAFTRQRQAAGLALASYVNRGRPTEPDREALEQVLPNIVYPQATNTILQEFINSLLQTDFTDSPDMANSAYIQMRSMVDSIIQPSMAIYQAGKAQGLSDEAINEAILQTFGGSSGR